MGSVSGFHFHLSMITLAHYSSHPYFDSVRPFPTYHSPSSLTWLLEVWLRGTSVVYGWLEFHLSSEELCSPVLATFYGGSLCRRSPWGNGIHRRSRAQRPQRHVFTLYNQIAGTQNLTLLGMDLVRRGRLSVQRVNMEAWDAIMLLAENGGWDDLNFKTRKLAVGKGKSKMKKRLNDASSSEHLSDSEETKVKAKLAADTDEVAEDGQNVFSDRISPKNRATSRSAKRKRKVEDVGGLPNPPTGRSTRTKKWC